MFSLQKLAKIFAVFCADCQKAGFTHFSVDKPGCLWLNSKHNQKDIDGNLAPFGSCREPAVGESRCGRSEQSASRVDPANRQLSSGIRLPPLRAGTLLEVREWFSFGKAIRVVPRMYIRP